MKQTMNPLVFRVDGLLDLKQANEVARRLRSAPSGAEIVIEFAPSARCGLVPLSLVAEAIIRHERPVSVRGLAQHDIRFLRYLGVQLPSKDESGPRD